MKRSKKTNRLIALSCALLITCGAAAAVISHEEKKEKIRTSDEVILQIPAQSVTALSWETEDASLSFHKDDGWHYDEDDAFPVDEQKMDELLTPFEAFGVSFVIDDVEDFGQYGLDAPACTIQLTAGDDAASYEIKLGNFSAMDAQRYVSIGDGKVYLVSSDPMELYKAQLKDMIQNDEDLSYDRISGISFSGTENYTITYEENSPAAVCDDDVYFTEHGGVTVALDTPSVSTFLSYMTTLDPEDYVTYKVTEEELPAYGLDQPELTITVDYTKTAEEGEAPVMGTYVLHIGRSREEVKAYEEAAAKAEEEGDEDFHQEPVPAYARIGDSPIVYHLPQYDYGMLTAVSFDDLRHHEAFAADFEDIDRAEITLDGSTYTLLQVPAAEEEAASVWKYGETQIDSTAFQSALTELVAEEYTDEAPTGQEEISLTIHLKNENHPQIRIQLFRYDGEACLAVVDGVPFALVRRSTVVDLMESVRSIVLKK